jgi:hypothetical protein
MDRMKVPMTWIVVCLATLVATAGHADGPLRRHAGRRLVPGLWITEVDKLVASDAASGSLFGWLSTASGDVFVVGARDDSPGGITRAGAAYVFLHSGGVWTEHQKLVASDADAWDLLGMYVNVLGDTIFLWSSHDDVDTFTDAGSVYVFTRSGDVWTEHQKLTEDPPASFNGFGDCLVGDGPDRLLIGTCAGEAVYDFRLVADQWTQHERLTALDGVPGDQFGNWVARDGDTLMVAAMFADHSTLTDAGAVYVFERSGDSWAEVQKLTAADAASGDTFGNFVEIDGDTAVVGAINDDHSGFEDAGSLYVFNRIGGVWTETQKLVAHDPGTDRGFGFSPWLDGDRLTVGASTLWWQTTPDAGALYVFTRQEGTWIERQEFTPADGEVGDAFGSGICASGGFIFTGAPLDDHPPLTDAGSMYVLTLAAFFDDFESGDTMAWSEMVP